QTEPEWAEPERAEPASRVAATATPAGGPSGPGGDSAAPGRAVAADRALAELAGMTPRQRAVALLDAEGRSEPEMVELLGLPDRAVARSRPVVPLPELTTALSTVDIPVPVAAVTARAARIRRQRRIISVLVAVLLVGLAVPLLRAVGSDDDSTDAA